MNTPLRKTWKTADDLLIFNFDIWTGPEQQTGMQVEVVWVKTPMAPYTFSLPNLFAQVSIYNRFPDGMVLKGTIKGVSLQSSGNLGQGAVLGDFHYGNHDYRHFEGTMITYPLEIPNPPDPFHPDPGTDVEIDASGPFGDLFPYIFLHGWPQMQPDEIAFQFVTFDLPSPPGADYAFTLQLLSDLQKPDARLLLQNDAVNFIEGLSFPGEYAASPKALEGPIQQFAQLDFLLMKTVALDGDQVLAEVLAFLGMDRQELSDYLQSEIYQSQLARVWQSFFALVIVLGYRVGSMDQWIATLRISHLLPILLQEEDLEPKTLDRLIRATVVLPSPLFPLPTLGQPVPSANGYVRPYALGDLQMVRQRLLGYRSGEIARIVNVMPGERKEWSLKRNKSQWHEEHQENVNLERTDQTQSEQQTDFVAETLKTLAGKNKSTQFQNFQTNYGPPTTATLNGGWDVTTTPKEPGKKEASRFAREILGQTQTHISRQVILKRRFHQMDSHQECERAILDNRQNASPVQGVYRWLNKVLYTQVVRYGIRLLLNVRLFDPGRFLCSDAQMAQSDFFQRPPQLQDFDIHSFEDITPSNYAQLAAVFQVQHLQPPPEPLKTVSAGLSGQGDTQVTLPEGYLAQSAWINVALNEGIQTVVQGLVGTTAFSCQPGSQQSLSLQGETGQIPIAASGQAFSASPPESVDNFFLNVVVRTVPGQRLMAEWQISVYQSLVLAQNEAIKRSWGHDQLPQKKLSPQAIGLWEHQALKRGSFSIFLGLAESLVGSEPSSPPNGPYHDPGLNPFLERALEWDEMSFTLFQNPSALPEPLIGTEMPVPLADFARASEAQILLPVHPDYNQRFLFFLQSGLVWPGGEPFTPAFVSDVDLVSQVKRIGQSAEISEPVGSGWEVLVPTEMQVLESQIPWTRSS